MDQVTCNICYDEVLERFELCCDLVDVYLQEVSLNECASSFTIRDNKRILILQLSVLAPNATKCLLLPILTSMHKSQWYACLYDFTDRVRNLLSYSTFQSGLALRMWSCRQHCYGDIYSSPGLSLKQKQLMTLAFLVSPDFSLHQPSFVQQQYYYMIKSFSAFRTALRLTWMTVLFCTERQWKSHNLPVFYICSHLRRWIQRTSDICVNPSTGLCLFHLISVDVIDNSYVLQETFNVLTWCSTSISCQECSPVWLILLLFRIAVMGNLS